MTNMEKNGEIHRPVYLLERFFYFKCIDAIQNGEAEFHEEEED